MNRTPCGLVTTSPIVSGLFPPGIVATAVRGDVYPRDLYPEEAEIVETAAPKRQREFAAGRLCARLALSELGIHGFPLTVASNRSALWPHGVVGSITHTSGFCAAVVGCGRAFGGLGIDAERCGRIGPDLMPRICTPGELEWLLALSDRTQSVMATVIFGAKEALYKCLQASTTTWVDFQDVTVRCDGDRFEASVHGSAVASWRGRRLVGRFHVEEDLVLCGMAIAA